MIFCKHTEATNKARQRERNIRLKRGKTFDEFVKVWEKKKPPEEVLRFYGEWPIPFSD